MASFPEVVLRVRFWTVATGIWHATQPQETTP